MPNIAQVLKDEIRRLAKLEAKVITGNLKADVIKLKKSNVAMKKMLIQLKRDTDLLLIAEKRRQLNAPVIAPDKAKARITSKSIRTMRKKLKMSQEQFAKLVKVSGVSVCLWEKKDSALRLRDATRAAILSLRGVGAKEARKRLEMVEVKKAKKVKRGKMGKKMKKA